MRRGLAAVVVALMVAGAASLALAVSVKSWEAASGQAFVRGTLDGVQVDGRGRLSLSPKFETLWGPEEGIVWAVAPDGAGGAFVGLSGPGRVIHVPSSGEAEVWHEIPDDGLVTAMVADGKGGVFVGVSPAGQVVHVTGKETVEELVATGAEFVWAVLLTGDGLWIGTGVPGKILLRLPDGRVETRYESPQDPVRCLAAYPGGGVVAGTGQSGLVIRVGVSDRAFVVLDADQPEIVSLAADDDGGLYALAAGTVTQTAAPTRAPKMPQEPSVTVTVTAEAPPENPNSDEKKPPAESAAPKAPKRPGAVLHRIDRDGGTWTMWQSAAEVPYAVLLDEQGFPMIATGDRGKLLRFDDRGNAIKVLRFPSATATTLVRGDNGRVLIGGSSDARLAVLGPEIASAGTYVTETIDAGSAAEWGRLEWDAEVPKGAGLTFRARSGNTEEPDETWSGWARLVSTSGGSDAEITAPAARRLQLEVSIESGRGGNGPAVRRVTAFYQPRNRPPQIESLTVEHPGVAWTKVQQQGSTSRGPQVADDPISRAAAAAMAPTRRAPTPVRRSYESGARTFSWKTVDPDGDTLVFALEFRPEDGDHWYPLASEITERFYSWDSRGMPDGDYRVRLLADDARDNSPGTGFVRERVSDPFRIDHSPPAVTALEVERTDSGFVVTFKARDPGGVIAAAEFLLEDGRWKPIVPVDGVADSEVESYRLEIPRGSRDNGERDLRLRVIDTLGNLGGEFTVLTDG
jgi:hypothetical protein